MTSSREHDGQAPLLSVEGLSIHTRAGREVLHEVSLDLAVGEIVVLLGPSGAGKSTLLRALREDTAELAASGLLATSKRLERNTPIGVVPQRGALFDHLDVRGNLALAMRNASPPAPATRQAVAQALTNVELPAAWADRHGVERLSGGEAQRLAVARTLAGGRRVLFLDEPTVGLDPARVASLARLLRRSAREGGAAMLIVTHDLDFAAWVADRFITLRRGHVHDAMTVPPLASLDPGQVMAREEARVHALRRWLFFDDQPSEGATPESGGTAPEAPAPSDHPSLIRRSVDWLGTWPAILAALPGAMRRRGDLPEVLRPALAQAVLRPLPFFAGLALLIGFSVLYVVHRSVGGGQMPLRTDRVFSLLGSMHIIALVPALAAVTYTATAGNAITAWLGSMSLTRQVEALESLGISRARYLWVPCAFALVAGFLATCVLFVTGMVAGGVVYAWVFAPEVSDAWGLLAADLLDPPPQRDVLRTRGVLLCVLYGLVIGSDAIAKGGREFRRAEEVTVAMVRSVMTVTVTAGMLELLTLAFLFSARSGP